MIVYKLITQAKALKEFAFLINPHCSKMWYIIRQFRNEKSNEEFCNCNKANKSIVNPT